jgi:hypothetical protein
MRFAVHFLIVYQQLAGWAFKPCGNIHPRRPEFWFMRVGKINPAGVNEMLIML